MYVIFLKYGHGRSLCEAGMHSADAAPDPLVSLGERALPHFGEG